MTGDKLKKRGGRVQKSFLLLETCTNLRPAHSKPSWAVQVGQAWSKAPPFPGGTYLSHLPCALHKCGTSETQCLKDGMEFLAQEFSFIHSCVLVLLVRARKGWGYTANTTGQPGGQRRKATSP